jgi:hypothetical protein
MLAGPHRQRLSVAGYVVPRVLGELAFRPFSPSLRSIQQCAAYPSSDSGGFCHPECLTTTSRGPPCLREVRRNPSTSVQCRANVVERSGARRPKVHSSVRLSSENSSLKAARLVVLCHRRDCRYRVTASYEIVRTREVPFRTKGKG